jgi:hypothetical protein
MKIKHCKQTKYYTLVNSNNLDLRCPFRQNTRAIIPDNLNPSQPALLELPHTTDMCGDWCPFFQTATNADGTVTVRLGCKGMDISNVEVEKVLESKFLTL